MLKSYWVEIDYGIENGADAALWPVVGKCSLGHDMHQDPSDPEFGVCLGCDAVLQLKVPSDADMIDELRASLAYRGWTCAWEFPGFGCWSHPDTDVIVCATSDWNRPGFLDIQLQRSWDGLTIDDGGCEIPWPMRERSTVLLFAHVKPFLDRYQPKFPLAGRMLQMWDHPRDVKLLTHATELLDHSLAHGIDVIECARVMESMRMMSDPT